MSVNPVGGTPITSDDARFFRIETKLDNVGSALRDIAELVKAHEARLTKAETADAVQGRWHPWTVILAVLSLIGTASTIGYEYHTLHTTSDSAAELKTENRELRERVIVLETEHKAHRLFPPEVAK